jgi:hypothetical protein
MALDENPLHPTTGNKVVYFGGCCDVNHKALDGTFYWDGSAWTEVQNIPDPKPCKRTSTRMAWDPVTGDLVLFGGTAGPLCPVAELAPLNDTWLFDGAIWHNCASCTAPPSARASQGLATDEDADNVVLFGGNTSLLVSGPEEGLGPVDYNGETWVFTGISGQHDGSWAQKVPPSPPCSRTSAGMSWDGATGRHKVVLFGGQGTVSPGCAGGLYNDTWVWNASQGNWTLCQANCGSPPTKRFGHRMAWDPAIGPSGRAVMFGGTTQVLKNDTGTIDGVWTPCSGTCVNPLLYPRCCVGLAYDPAVGLLLFGGQYGDAGNRAEYGDTWYFDGNQWTCLLGCP